MKTLALSIILLSALLPSPSAFGETSGKSPEQLRRECDAVIVGKVKDVSHFKEIGDNLSFFCAEIKVERIEKGLQGEPRLEVVKVYYVNATKAGVFGDDAPRFKVGDRVRLLASFKAGVLAEGFALVVPSIENVEKLAQPTTQ